MESTPLKTKVFLSSDKQDGFGVTSTIIYGEQEAILVDAQFTLANAHRLVAELLELQRNLTTIFITHLHPDHYLGIEVIKQVWPEARIIAYREIADEINDAWDFKIAWWGRTILKKNGATIKFTAERLEEEVIWLEGQPIEIPGVMCGDCIEIAPLWIPATRTLIASDLVFSDCHVWLADMRTPERLQKWLASLDRLEKMKPETVIPGHSSSTLHLMPSAISFTRRYIHDFFRQFAKASDGRELQENMDRLYPEMPLRICLEYSCRILKDHYFWPGDWPLSLREMPATF